MDAAASAVGRGRKRGSSASCHAGETGAAAAAAEAAGVAGSLKEEFFRHGPLGMFLVVPAVNVRQSTVPLLLPY